MNGVRLALAALALLALAPLAAGAEQLARPELSGVWFSPLIALEDPRWRIEDLVCAKVGCSLPAFEYLQGLLADPNNDARPLRELDAQMQAFNDEYVSGLLTPAAKRKQAEFDPANDPVLECKPDGDGLRHQILAPLPTEIEQHEDKVILRYEYWNAVRTVYMDGRPHPKAQTPSRLGFSTGWYEGPTLVVETSKVIPNLVTLPGGSIKHSPDARFFERYTRSADGERLDLEWSIVDPVNFREPYVGQRSFLYYPDEKLNDFECEAITGEF